MEQTVRSGEKYYFGTVKKKRVHILVSGAITLVKAGAHDAEKPQIE